MQIIFSLNHIELIFLSNKILILKNRKIIKILRINVEATRGIKNLTLYIYYWFSLFFPVVLL